VTEGREWERSKSDRKKEEEDEQEKSE